MKEVDDGRREMERNVKQERRRGVREQTGKNASMKKVERE